MPTPADDLRTTADAVARLGSSAADFAALDDSALLAAQQAVALNQRANQLFATWIAGEIARRSGFERGQQGLARRTGYLSPEALIQSVSGGTHAEATKLVHVGMLATSVSPSHDADGPTDSPPPAAPWREALAHALTAGGISIDAVEVIRSCFDRIEADIPADEILSATRDLIAASAVLNADQLLRRARQLRDQLDAEGFPSRQRRLRDRRYFKAWEQTDGMIRGSFLLDAEDGAFLMSALHAATSPRRGGPRPVDPTVRAEAERLLADERSIEQIAADAFIDLLHVAVDADPAVLPGKRRPAVRVIVTEHALRHRSGSGRLEGHTDPVPLTTVDRHLCNSGMVPIAFDDDGQCVNVGRTQRLFTERQRLGMTVRDGGCRFPDCDRPPSFCEAHHINQWYRDGGRTDVADGILLCRRHHLLLHNDGWEITRTDADYRLRPPITIDPSQQLIPMPSKGSLVTHPDGYPGTAIALHTASLL
ncbi:MAG TPA: DUF222 domain-containing protein [Lacisediminihabitans sp.]|uniref:DUF222 domain-containing protein n=1 Tax=Lacisediminihabitans sp. TaxID=2787631 RepID=UPI002EDAF39B